MHLSEPLLVRYIISAVFLCKFVLYTYYSKCKPLIKEVLECLSYFLYHNLVFIDEMNLF